MVRARQPAVGQRHEVRVWTRTREVAVLAWDTDTEALQKYSPINFFSNIFKSIGFL